jgi:hypothetical protein
MQKRGTHVSGLSYAEPRIKIINHSVKECEPWEDTKLLLR